MTQKGKWLIAAFHLPPLAKSLLLLFAVTSYIFVIFDYTVFWLTYSDSNAWGERQLKSLLRLA